MKLSVHEQKVAIKHLECAYKCLDSAIKAYPQNSQDAEQLALYKDSIRVHMENVSDNAII